MDREGASRPSVTEKLPETEELPERGDKGFLPPNQPGRGRKDGIARRGAVLASKWGFDSFSSPDLPISDLPGHCRFEFCGVEE